MEGDHAADKHQEIDAALQHWRQGDCMLGEEWFVYRFLPACPLTDDARAVAAEGGELISTAVRGYAVVTQTCDIVRACLDRPFIEIVPLVEVSPTVLREVQRGRRPMYAYIPGVAEQGLVTDLERVMTVEKAVVAQWQRVQGCRDDVQARALAQALARKRVRFAFPDDFTGFADRLSRRLQERHDRQSDEGRALRTLHEIRVHASPSWDADTVELMFWFIRGDEAPDFEGRSWQELLDGWLKLIPPAARFRPVEGQVVTLDDLTARDYVESDPLDLDHLTSRNTQQ